MTKIYIGGLHWSTTAAKLQHFLEAWGLHPERLELPVDIDGISKRYAIAFIPEYEVNAAVALSGKNVDATPIRIRRAGEFGKKGRKK